ncbi:ATP-binding protein [Chitinophaga horti]|uniref:histidine kinase n=1 Tax=Chitinophaga horti TaxID=2920382 RepID=A0ABY6J756_9BACT|nr:response regulator [Chitinophaga horti]UYQ95473.1 ATP-binding protein [Chitinophaga horti]
MTQKRFIYLIIAAFITGTTLMLYIHYNSSRNINNLVDGNAKLLRELRLGNCLGEVERDIIWVESRIRAAIATDDTSHIEGVNLKIAEVESLLDTIEDANVDPAAVKHIERLGFLAREKLTAKNKLMHEFFRSGHMDDTSLIANPRAREISNEISQVTRAIFDSRQSYLTVLSTSIEADGKKALQWNIILIVIVVLAAGAVFWFIIDRYSQQSALIVRLDASEKKVRETAQIKENFLANMSHEIRTPLNAMLGFTNLLKVRQLDGQSQQFVGAIQSAGENLMTIVNDILDLSKIEAGMMRIETSTFSVRGLLHSVETLFSEKVREKELRFAVDIDKGIPDTLIGDPVRLTQILVNLIENAIKFTDKGAVNIRVENKETDGSKITLGFLVQDTGIGIDPKKLAAIFERFLQAEDSITRRYGGTGLGLSIVKKLVELQRGEVSVESTPGKGTSFRVSIPYRISTEQFTLKLVQDVTPYKREGSAPVHLLVVDDNRMNQELMRHLLAQWQLNFDIAGDGMTALNMLQEKHYDLVLMDIQMPGMDGYTAAQSIRQQLHLNVPIIAMTAHAMAGEREKCLSYGMNDYISKPVNERILHDLIIQFTGGREQPASATQQYQYINLGYLQSVSKGNRNYEKKATCQFIEMIPEELQLMQQAIGQHDVPALHRTAHSMKTSVSIMGLTERLQRLLDLLEYTTGKDEASTAFMELRNICEGALEEARHFHARL